MSIISALQKILPQHLLTKLMGKFANCKINWFKNFFILLFIKIYHVNLTEAKETNPRNYPTFNAFFTRHLKESARSIIEGHQTIASPVDGFIYHYGKIGNEQIFSAKGFKFTLEALLANQHHYTNLCKEGDFICMYLSPKDYHRVHIPFKGTLKHTTYVPGKLFSVDPKVLKDIPDVFARNERLICLFETNFGPMIIVLIGAMIVASIHTVWADCINSMHAMQLIKTDYSQDNIILEKGAELGHFQLGSTVICLFPKDTIQFTHDLNSNTHLKMGELIASC